MATFNPPPPRSAPSALVSLTDVIDKVGGPSQSDVPTWSDLLGAFWLAPGGVLPDYFGPGQPSAAFPGGLPPLVLGENLAAVGVTSPYLDLKVPA